MKTANIRPIILVGGGTGGHITPLIAVAEELMASGQPFVFVGGKDSLEERLVRDQGWSFIGISSGKWRRYTNLTSVWQNLVDLVRVKIAFWQAVRIILRTRARVVFSKGGSVALPVVIAAAVLRRKIIIHESDSVMGLSNRISRLFAAKVLTGFPLDGYGFDGEKYRFVGVPVRRFIRQAAASKRLVKARPLVFVVAGSQGSSAINKLIKESLEEILSIADLVHIAGEREYESFKQLQQGLDRHKQAMYRVFSYIGRELPYYFAMSDIIISRASATVICEAALFNRAMILVPLPNSAGDHQEMNAKLLTSAGAALTQNQSQLTVSILLKTIREMLADDARRKQLGDHLGRYFVLEESANKLVVKEILR